MITVGFTRAFEDSIEMTAIKLLTEEILIGDYTALEHVLEPLQSGDCLVIYKLSQLGGNVFVIAKNAQLVIEKGVILKSLSEGIDTSTDEGQRQIKLVGELAQQTGQQSGKTLTQGRKIAQEKGVKFGPQKGAVYKYEDIAQAVYAMYLTKEYSMEDIRKHFNIGSRQTVYTIINRLKNASETN